MNNAGIIYEILKDRVVILNPEGEFIFIRKKSDASIGQVVMYDKADIISNSRFEIYVSAVAVIAAVLMFAFIFANSFFKADLNDVYGFADVDINPSVEFAFNREYRVLSMVPLNDDSRKVLEGMDLEGSTVDSAVCQFVDKSKKLGFIKHGVENVILVSASLDKAENLNIKNNKDDIEAVFKIIKTGISESNRNGGLYITSKTIKVAPRERELALKNKLSMGRYYLYSRAKEQGNDIKIDEIDDESIHDLMEKAGMVEDELKTAGIVPSKPVPMAAGSANATPSKVAQKVEASSTTMPKSKLIPTPENTKGRINTPDISPKQTSVINGKLKVRFYSIEKRKSTQGVHINFQVVNTGTSALVLKDVKVRYYFKKEGTSAIRYAPYYYSLGSKTDIQGTCFSMSGVNGADSYMEITFDKGLLQPGKTVWIEGEMLDANWGYFDQANDYSFNPEDTESVDWNKMTAYISDTLIWGVEPR